MSSHENAATSLPFRDGGILPAERPLSRRGPWLQLGSVRGFEWNSHELAIENLPATLGGLRVVHFRAAPLRPRWHAAYDELIARLRDDPPDLILCSGDFIDYHFDQRPTWPILQ